MNETGNIHTGVRSSIEGENKQEVRNAERSRCSPSRLHTLLLYRAAHWKDGEFQRIAQSRLTERKNKERAGPRKFKNKKRNENRQREGGFAMLLSRRDELGPSSTHSRLSGRIRLIVHALGFVVRPDLLQLACQFVLDVRASIENELLE